MSYIEYHFPPSVKAFSTCRDDGCGEGAYGTFNCTHYCGDNADHVAANRERLCADWQIAPDRLFIPRQVHDTRIAIVDEAFLAESLARQTELLEGVDALISPLAQCCLAISTADCVPVLLHDERTGVIAAIHAGWRGTVARIVEQTMEKMTTLYGTRGEDICAAIGPSISQASFEVGDEVYQAFDDAGFPMDRIAVHQEKWHIDLWEANRLQLVDAGVGPSRIEVAGICTYLHVDRFFSARRLGIMSGRMLTGIMRMF